jgi:hypothetical protein
VNSAQQFVLNKKKQITAKQNSLFIYIPPTVLTSQTKKPPCCQSGFYCTDCPLKTVSLFAIQIRHSQFTPVFGLGQRGAFLINPPALFWVCEIVKNPDPKIEGFRFYKGTGSYTFPD